MPRRLARAFSRVFSRSRWFCGEHPPTPPPRRTSRWATPTPPASAPAPTSPTAPPASARSYAFPSLIAAARGYALKFRACSGAKVSDVTSNQLGALSAEHELRDPLGRRQRRRLHQRAHRPAPSRRGSATAAGPSTKAHSYITNTLPGSLATLYAAIRSKAPNAQVVVVGYPRLFNGEDCNALTWFSPSEESSLNATADLLNSKLAAAATAQGFAFANPTSAFIGHAVCGSPEWLNGLSNPISESYHPNRTGHASGYTPLVSPLLTAPASVTSPSSPRRGAGPGAGRAAAAVRRRRPRIEPGRRTRCPAADGGADKPGPSAWLGPCPTPTTRSCCRERPADALVQRPARPADAAAAGAAPGHRAAGRAR